VSTEADEEPRVERVVPEALDDATHGRVYLVFGSLQAGAPRYEPDPERTARWLAAAPERERQARRFTVIQQAIELERMQQMRMAI
jgi:hypothetical protein